MSQNTLDIQTTSGKAQSTAAPASLAELWQAHRGSVSVSEGVYLALRGAITSGLLKPGDHLAEPAIAETLGISRTPIREALQRLETQRLVERSVGRRLIVSEVTPEEILDVYAVREVLNALAARLAAENASTSDLVRLRRLHRELRWALEDGDVQRMATLNFEFHDAICAASRNGFLLATLRQAHDTHQRYPGSTFSLPQRAKDSVNEHEQMLAAIAEGDGDRAEQLAHQHIAGIREVRIAMLDGTVEEQRRRSAATEAEATGTDATA